MSVLVLSRERMNVISSAVAAYIDGVDCFKLDREDYPLLHKIALKGLEGFPMEDMNANLFCFFMKWNIVSFDQKYKHLKDKGVHEKIKAPRCCIISSKRRMMVFKAIDALLYQLEGPLYKSALYNELEKLQQVVGGHIIRSSKEYSALPWS